MADEVDKSEVISSIADIKAIEREKAQVLTALTDIKTGIEEVGKQLVEMYKELKGSETFKQLVDITKRYNDEVKRASELSEAYKQKLEMNAKLENDLTEAKRKAAEAEVRLAGERRSAAAASDALTGASKKQAAAAAAVNISWSRSQELLERYGVSLEASSKRLNDNKKALSGVKDEIKKLEKDRTAGTVSAKEYGNKLKELTAEEAKLKASVSESRINLNQLAKATIQATDSDKQRGLVLGQLREAYRNLSQAEKGSAEGMELLEHIQALDPAVKNADASIGNFQRNVGNYRVAVEDLKEQLSDAAAALRGMEAGMQASAAAQAAAQARVDELAAAMQKMKDEGKDTTAEYNRWSEAVRRMEADGRAHTARYDQMVVIMQQMESAGKANTAEFAALKRAFDEAGDSLKKLRSEYNLQSDTYTDLQNRIADTEGQIALFTKHIADSTEKLDPMRTRLNELKHEAQELYKAMKSGNATEEMAQRFQEVTQEAAKLQESISDVNARVKHLASSTAFFNTLTTAIRGAVGVVQTYQGAMAMAGVESERFKEVLLKLQGAQAVVNGLTQISNALNSRSALMVGLATAAQSKSIVVKKLATAAQWALNKAVMANPYIIAAAALAALVALLYKFIKSNSEAAQIQSDLNDVHKESIKITKEEVSNIVTLVNTAKLYVVGSKERASAIKQLNEQYGDYLPKLLSENATVEELAEAYDILNESIQYHATVKAALGKMEEYAAEKIELLGKEIEAQEKVNRVLERRNNLISMGYTIGGEEKDKDLIRAKEKLAEVQEDNAKAAEKIARKEVAVMGAAQKATEAHAKARYRDADATKEQEAAQKALADLTRKLEDVQLGMFKSAEARQRKALELAKSRAVEDFNAQKEALSKTEDEKKKNAARIAKIDELISATQVKYRKDAAELEVKFAHEAAQSAINIRLLAAKAGSEEELQARKDMVDEALKYELSQLPAAHHKRKELEVKAAKEKEELDREAKKRARDIELENTNIRLEYAKKGSDEELVLTVKKLELERDAEVAEAEKTGADVEAIKQKWAKHTADAVGEWTKGSMDERTRVEMEALDERGREEQAALAQQYADGEIKYEEYEREKEKIAAKYSQDALRLQIGNLKALINSENLSNEQRKEAMKELAKIEKQLDDEVTDEKVANKKREEDAEKELAEKKKELSAKTMELAQAVADFALQLVNQMYEARIEALEAEKEELQKAYDKEIENIEASGYSTEEAEARKRAAKAKSEADQKKMDERIKQEKVKQFNANKAASIIQALINTAMSITAALTIPPPVGTAMAIVNAAMGAVQVAAIAAQPVPKYAHGRRGGREEWAIVGDAGVSEVIAPRQGKPYLTPDKPTIARLGAGDDVYASLQEYARATLSSVVPDYARRGELPQASVNVDLTKLVEEQRRQTGELKEAIKRQSEMDVSKRYGLVKTVIQDTNSARTIASTIFRS